MQNRTDLPNCGSNKPMQWSHRRHSVRIHVKELMVLTPWAALPFRLVLFTEVEFIAEPLLFDLLLMLLRLPSICYVGIHDCSGVSHEGSAHVLRWAINVFHVLLSQDKGLKLKKRINSSLRHGFQTSSTAYRTLTDVTAGMSNNLWLQNYSHKSVTPEPFCAGDCSWWVITPSDWQNYILRWWSFSIAI